MKNKEKFIDKLADFACIRDNIAMNVKGEVVGCRSIQCKDCEFYEKGADCETVIRRWLEEEYIEPLMISRKDIRLLDCIEGDYKYIARDYDGDIFLYINKPEKCFGVWYSKRGKGEYVSIKSFDVCFPMIKRADTEPWKIDDLKKLEVCEDYEQTN